MNVRLHERVPADIEIRVTNLSRPEETVGWMVDASQSGLALLLRIRMISGELVKLDVEDGQLFGHIIYVKEENGMYRTGIAVENVLLGGSDLGRLVKALSGGAAADAVTASQPE